MQNMIRKTFHDKKNCVGSKLAQARYNGIFSKAAGNSGYAVKQRIVMPVNISLTYLSII